MAKETNSNKTTQDAIVIDTNIDKTGIEPEKIPEMAQQLNELFSDLGLILQETATSVCELMESLNFDHEALRLAMASLGRSAQALDKIYNSYNWHKLEALFPGLEPDNLFDASVITGDPEGTPTLDNCIELFNTLSQLLPCIESALKAYKEENNLQEITFIQFFEAKDPATGKPAESLFSRCLNQAQSAPHINTNNKVTNLTYPLDKVNGTIWSELDSTARHSDGLFYISTGDNKDARKIAITYDIDFKEKEEELNKSLKKISNTPPLTTRTKRVMIAANELYKHGDTFSRTQLYYAMGYTGRPGSSDLDSLEKELDLLLSPISINNLQEIEAGYKYPAFKYAGALMPHERLTAWIDGKLTVDAIHLFRQPPLMEFAERRKNITTIGINLLMTPINKTIKNLSLEDYLLQRISRMNKEGSVKDRKILYATIYEKCGINERKQKTRLCNTIDKLLNYYKQEGFIKGFSKSKNKDGIIIKL